MTEWGQVRQKAIDLVQRLRGRINHPDHKPIMPKKVKFRYLSDSNKDHELYIRKKNEEWDIRVKTHLTNQLTIGVTDFDLMDLIDTDVSLFELALQHVPALMDKIKEDKHLPAKLNTAIENLKKALGHESS